MGDRDSEIAVVIDDEDLVSSKMAGRPCISVFPSTPPLSSCLSFVLLTVHIIFCVSPSFSSYVLFNIFFYF